MKTKILMIAVGVILLTACNSKSTSNESPKTDEMTKTEQSKDEHAMLGVQGNCDMCKERIEKAAKDMKGVTLVTWDIDKKELHLNFDPKQTNLDAISKAIAKAGHDTDKDTADQSAYDALPSCCKYRK